MKKMKWISVVSAGLAIAAIGTGCAKKTETQTQASDTAIADSLDLVSGKMAAVAVFDSTALSSNARSARHLRVLESAWDQAGAVNGLNWQPVSLKEYVGQALDDDFVNPNGANTTVFGRFKNSVKLLCAIDFVVPQKDANGLPAEGSYDVVVEQGPNSPISQRCDGMTSEETQSLNVKLVVSKPEGTLYTKKILVQLADKEEAETFFIKADSEAIRIATAEKNPSYQAAMRSVLDYDVKNKVLRFEYLSQSFGAQSSEEIQRIYADEINDKAHILSYSGASSLDMYFLFTASTRTNDDTRKDIAFSVGYKGQQIDAQAEILDRNACVEPENGNVIQDDTLACDVQGLAVSGASAIAASIAAHASEADIALDENTGVAFKNEQEMLTAVSE